MWQLLISFYFLFGVINYILRRVLAQKLGDHNRLINAIFFIFFLLPTTIILSFVFPHDLNVGLLNLLFLFLGSIIWPIGALVAFHANKKVDVGIFAVINNLSPVFTLIIAIPFLHENLKGMQWFGAGLLIFSGVLAASSQLKKHNRADSNGILMCILTAAIFGVAIAYERFMLSRIDFGAYLIYGWGSQIIWSVLLAGKEIKNVFKLFNKDTETRNTLIVWGSVNAFKAIVFIIALKSTSASIISVATNFMSVAVVIAAYFYLKERKHMYYKWAAAVIGVAGLLFIAS